MWICPIKMFSGYVSTKYDPDYEADNQLNADNYKKLNSRKCKEYYGIFLQITNGRFQLNRITG